MLATAGTIMLQNYNALMAGIVGTATAVYMSFKAGREILKWKRERQERRNGKLRIKYL